MIVQATPMLGEAEDDEPAALTLHAGDLVMPGADLVALKWHASMDGAPASREGMTFLLRPTSGSGTGYGFRPEFGPPVRVPTAAWFCRKGGVRRELSSSCEQSLVRVRTSSGAIAAFMVHAREPTPLVLHRNGSTRTLRVEPVSRHRLVQSGTSTWLLLEGRTSSVDGKLTGGRIVAVRLEGGSFVRLRPIATDEVDARDDQQVLSRAVSVQVADGAVRVVGVRRVVRRADGTEVESKPIDELHRLADLPVEP